MKVLKFKSLKVESEEEIISKTGQTRFKMVFKPETTEEHELTITTSEILKNKSWMLNFFLTLMITGALFGLLYGALIIAFNINFSHKDNAYIAVIFLVSVALTFISLWTGLSIPSAIKNIKQNHVHKERGKGNWKIVDNKDWDKFSRLLALSEKKDEE